MQNKYNYIFRCRKSAKGTCATSSTKSIHQMASCVTNLQFVILPYYSSMALCIWTSCEIFILLMSMFFVVTPCHDWLTSCSPNHLSNFICIWFIVICYINCICSVINFSFICFVIQVQSRAHPHDIHWKKGLCQQKLCETWGWWDCSSSQVHPTKLFDYCYHCCFSN